MASNVTIADSLAEKMSACQDGETLTVRISKKGDKVTVEAAGDPVAEKPAPAKKRSAPARPKPVMEALNGMA
jgi:hypothetical protein